MNTKQAEKVTNLRLDLGCGSCKKEGTIGIDLEPAVGVDHVVDIQNQPLPFPDASVEYVHTSHFLEHLKDLVKVFQEISRVCQNGATLEIWTPYAWTNDAFIFGHEFYFTEEIYLHLCYKYPEIWQEILKARWVLKEIAYVVHPNTILELYENGISLDFGISHHVNIVTEIGVFIEICHDNNYPELIPPKKSFAFTRYADRYLLKDSQKNNRQKNVLTKISMSRALIKAMGLKNFIDFAKKRILQE